MGFSVIFQVIGYQNSGKTTVITKLTEKLTSMGIRTGVIKHHGHDSYLEFRDEGKDTERHRTAGALITSVSSTNRSILTLDEALPLEKAIDIYKGLDIECILIEGYKKIQHSRIVLCRNEEDARLLVNASQNPIAIISDSNLKDEYECPFFFWNDENSWLPYIADFAANQVIKGRNAKNETF
jgi:molybdopterin-guanine dinucleotide biosynthesis adapter protein